MVVSDWMTFLIVCPLVGLAGFVDAIGGGGGLISLPAYIIGGIPMHQAIATNKLSSACGTTLAVFRFWRNNLINMKLAGPSVAAAIVGSALGARISLLLDASMMERGLYVVLPVTAFIVMNKSLFGANEGKSVVLNRRTYMTACIAAFVIGIYDGAYGPGTGTFLIISFSVFAKMGVAPANAQSKIINLATNVASLAVFLLSGNVLVTLGLAAAVCNMIGGYFGAGLVMQKGTKIVKPIILAVLGLLALKLAGVY